MVVSFFKKRKKKNFGNVFEIICNVAKATYNHGAHFKTYI